jgi:hypothetical protein
VSGRLSAVAHCVELALAHDARGLTIFDGATGQRADLKGSRYLEPAWLRGTGRSPGAAFEPSEALTPRNVFADAAFR